MPRGMADVTPEWLSSVLRASGDLGAAGRVVSVEHEVIGEDAGLTAALARLRPVYDGAAGPQSLILKMGSRNRATRELVSRRGMYEREVAFYSQMARYSPIRVPRCCYSAYDRDSRDFVLLLEELCGRQIDGEGGLSHEETMLALRELAKHHAAGGIARASIRYRPCPGSATVPRYKSPGRGRSYLAGGSAWDSGYRPEPKHMCHV